MKDSYYFPHDYHARHDPKLAALIKEFGMQGYGVYWNFVEILHEQGGKIEKFPKLFSAISSEFNLPEALLQKIISASLKDFCLFKEDDKYIWSERVLENIRVREEKRSQKVEAGRIGGIKSGEARSKMKQNEAPLEANEANEAKESKVKEIKEKESNTSTCTSDFFSYYCLKTKKAFKLTQSARDLINSRLKEGYTVEQLKTAVDNFVKDDWVDRSKHLDLIYCIGKQKGKPDNLEKWLNYKPTPKFVKP
jgi:uncharacterized phage protein (TIGR02220 family)